MYDLLLQRDDGTQVPISKITTEELHLLLKHGPKWRSDVNAEDVRDRLEIERLIRELGL